MRKFERFRRVTKGRAMSILTAGATALLSAILLSTPALAGEWRANSTGFWYINDDGSYPTYAWQWIDGDGDGVYQCFAFDENGYLMLNQTTPDGYLVGEAGAWFDGVTPVTRTYPVGTYGRADADRGAPEVWLRFGRYASRDESHGFEVNVKERQQLKQQERQDVVHEQAEFVQFEEQQQCSQ